MHAFGHSQGAMVATHVAMEGGYDAQTLVTFGSPVEGDVGDDTLSVALRHADDPVTALAAGGHPGSVGAPGSFVAERTADPLPGLHDIGIPAHHIESYTQTAQLLDDSDDPRMTAVRQVFDELGAAASVEVTEYSAERAGQSFFFGRRMMPKTQLMSEMMIAATTPHQKSSTRRPQLQKLVIHAVSHSRNALMIRPIRPSVRM